MEVIPLNMIGSEKNTICMSYKWCYFFNLMAMRRPSRLFEVKQAKILLPVLSFSHRLVCTYRLRFQHLFFYEYWII